MKSVDILEPYLNNMWGYLRSHEGYSVYADESGNMRKVRIMDSTKEELKYKFFVIGGIIAPSDFDLNLLKAEYDKKEGFPENEVK